ncbi:MAG: NAD(P)-binding protein [Oligoflexia bacterium]|nr:NAD(P)-binding protein [Oligoflexia bacterium]
MNQIYDVVVIGAGMSGLAATIRSLMFNKSVLLLEMHSVAGGLNSYYKRGSREFDVGLHALTNYAHPKNQNKNKNKNQNQNKNALLKVLRQLRIPFEKMQLEQQKSSMIDFHYDGCTLTFSNEIELLISEIGARFPREIDNFIKLLEEINSYADDDLYRPYISAKARVAEFISDPLLVEMIFTPLLLYGSSWENDIDYSQFVIMFRSIYLEGFSKPKGGVRTIINLLLSRLKDECACSNKDDKDVLQFNKRVVELKIDRDTKDKEWKIKLQSGEVFKSKIVISTIGYQETLHLLDNKSKNVVGKLSFTESILILDRDVNYQHPKHQDTSIIFYNNNSNKKFSYQRPTDVAVDKNSAVICFPNNFGTSSERVERAESTESMVRFSMLANYDFWSNYSQKDYSMEKEKLLEETKILLDKIIQSDNQDKYKILVHDIFTPKTIYKYSGHLAGSVYGAEIKLKDGKLLPYENLYIAGTDQGFLGIVGSLLSGITIANFYVLKEQE